MKETIEDYQAAIQQAANQIAYLKTEIAKFCERIRQLKAYDWIRANNVTLDKITLSNVDRGIPRDVTTPYVEQDGKVFVTSEIRASACAEVKCFLSDLETFQQGEK